MQWLQLLRAPLFTLSLAACAADGNGSCLAFPSEAQPNSSAVATTTLQMTDRGPVELLLVDAGDLYWYDEKGSILKLPRGEPRPLELRAAPGGFVGDSQRASRDSGLSIDGFTSDAEHLYWAEASRYTGPDSGFVVGFSPPSRLLAVAKNGGQAQVLLESMDRTLRPVAVESGRIIVLSNDGFYELARDASQLVPIRANPPVEGSQVVGNQIYWTESGLEEPRLLRARFDQAQPDVVADIEGSDFEVGPGYVLWRQERLRTEPELVLEQNFVLLDESTGCVQALPGSGESISFSTALDDEYIYWYSFNALGSVTDSSAAGLAPTPIPEMPLIRTSLRTGALERLQTPGFSLSLGDQIVGQDSEQLYVSTSQGLTAIRKP
jgi:hypothetical protein